MKRISTILSLIWCAVTAYGQGSTSAQYMLNPLSVNPGFTGYYGVLSASAQLRFQSVNVEGAPTTQTISLHSPLPIGYAAIGLQLWNESKAVFQQTGAFVSGAYRITLDQVIISTGLQAGLKINESNFASLRTRQSSDPAFNQNLRSGAPSAGVGVFVSHKKFSTGLSIPELLDSGDEVSVGSNRPVILTGGYSFAVHPDWKVKPNTLIRMVELRPVEINVNVNAVYKDVLSAGISYGFNNVGVLLLQMFATDQLQLGYTFETVLGDASSISAGTHEIGIQYLFNHSRKKSPSPRYF